ncbi:uncharacterized protein VICG_00877 [Vittaforma corneae ATCC 50505]|uniref:PSP1 C-terminal domain-containing protein n=1 Tax=Vittaforma corneae (strain ATCC 50505) TaxID=993615 RepID=L2GNF7_VITCO|nr:uncharacterized protein VICG_00877 [Vittaforma corneae ATCC 50505]ELA42030.1 hypothetical protein VICG_00877 [Vittaforma corneae ATCC 50505]
MFYLLFYIIINKLIYPMLTNYVFGRDSGIWAESSEKWDEAHSSWKIVGHDPRRILRDEVCLQDMSQEKMSQEIFHKSSIEHIFEYEGSFDITDNTCIVDSIQGHCHDSGHCARNICSVENIYYLVSYTSGKTCTASSKFRIDPDLYVIIEADRGEDCVQVKERIKGAAGEVKKILRKATQKDIDILEKKKAQEIKAIDKCNLLVRERGLPMEITGCEYQWDMKKITFYFVSDRRVDFRELVNDLFKYFKVRIWMSMENRK